MNSIVIAGVFTLIGAAIAAGAMWFVQMDLRKEKFKEIIYKEKLAVYQQLSEWTGMMEMNIVRTLWGSDDSPFEPLDADIKKKELVQKNAQFSDLLGSSLVISASVKEKMMNVQLTYIKLASEIAECLSGKGLPDAGIDGIIPFKKSCLDAGNRMRKELHIEAIDDSILGTFKKLLEPRKDNYYKEEAQGDSQKKTK